MTGIALSGKMRSGKDSTAKALAAMDPRFTRVAFADRLKAMAGAIVGEDFGDEATKAKHRQYLILFGQALRAYDGLYWVKAALAGLKELPPGAVPVVTDVRFRNEADALREAGFMLVRIEAKPETIKARGGAMLDDPSETDLDSYPDWDLVLDTESGSPEDLASSILAALRGFA